MALSEFGIRSISSFIVLPNWKGILYPTVSGILIVVAPALIAASIILQRKSVSERPASSGLNSILSVNLVALFTERTAWLTTSSGVIPSFIFI